MDPKDKTLLELLETKESRKTVLKTSKPEVLKAVTSYSTTSSNNWMNIRHSKAQTWLGETSNLGGFVVFEKPEYSIRAFYKVLASYAKQGIKTIETIANKYAPRTDGNNPDTYVKLVKEILAENNIKWSKDMVIPSNLYPYLGKVFLKIESGIDKPLDWFTQIYKTYM